MGAEQSGATGLVDDGDVDEAVRYPDSEECAALSAGLLTAWGRKPPNWPGMREAPAWTRRPRRLV
ncbi:hypothetical protein GCM10027075_24720 [Streptomyces heilongjiangensis]